MNLVNKLGAVGAFALAGAAVANAGALDLKGSDTLEHLTKHVITGSAACGASLAASLNYTGGGSGLGESTMALGNQQVAPMSKFLGTLSCGVNNGTTSEGYAPALDGIAIVQSRREGAPNECDTNADGICAEACPAGVDKALYGCKDRQNIDQQCVAIAYSTATSNRFLNVKEKNGVAALQCNACTNEDADAALEYKLTDWKDALRVLYFGLHHDNTVACNSDVRFTLADEWASFTRSSCAGQRCTKISHVWRRDDLSGTTDTFKSLIASSSSLFCNGVDYQDNDPIRRACTASEQVCQANGTLGLVLPISVIGGLSGGAQYNQTVCQAGNFANAPAPGGGVMLAPRSATNTFNCLNSAANTPIVGVDGRSFNLVMRNANGTIILDTAVVPREVTGAFQRIHVTTPGVLAGDGEACRRDNATVQIGCLTQASPCSIGFAGLEALTTSGATNLKVNNQRPTKANIRKLLVNPVPATVYPLSRKLYINSHIGFENVAGAEDTLVDRFRDRACADEATLSAGFVTIDDTQVAPVPCQDYNEQTGCAQASNNNACANN